MQSPTRGIIGILRGVTPDNAESIAQAAFDGGIDTLEVALNSPDALNSISRIAANLPAGCSVGAGTVLTPDAVSAAHDAGGTFIVAPNVTPDVIKRASTLGMNSYPGVATPTEALTALEAGATAIKIFPAIQVTSAGMGAWRAILPDDTGIFPVGGVGPAEFAEWIAAGATGFGIGSSLYKPSFTADEVRDRAATIIRTWNEFTGGAQS